MKKIFLMCSERSGSNLITKIFNSHSKICGPSTAHICDIIIPNLYKYGDFKNNNWDKLIADICFLLKNKNAVWKKSYSEYELKNNVEEGDVGFLFSYIFEEEAKSNNKKIIFIKENRIYEFSQFLVTHYPESQYVYMVRDPRDMAASWKNSIAIRGGVVRAANVWKADQTGFMKMRAWLNSQSETAFLRYEDLLSNPHKKLLEICNKLNIKYSNELFEFYAREDTVENSKAAVDWKNIAKPIMLDNYGKYKDNLTQDEIIYVESLCKNEMEALSYQVNKENIINGEDLLTLEKKLTDKELNVKLSYNSVSEIEKEKRAFQYNFSNELKHRPFEYYAIK